MTVIAVVWVQLIVLHIATHGSISSDPAGLLLYFGGPVTVTALSVMEITRLRQVPGLDLRGAPPSRPLPRGLRQRFTGTATLLSMLGGLPIIGVAMVLIVAAITLHPSGGPATEYFVSQVRVSAISPDGAIIAASLVGGTTELLSARTGQVTQTLPVPDGNASAMAFSPRMTYSPLRRRASR